MNIKLPCPRFELRWIKTGKDWTQRECVYSLVIPLRELDIRSEKDDGTCKDEITLEIGRTVVGGGNGKPPVWEDGTVDTPFRDSAHAKWDCKALGNHLPIVAICEEVASFVEKLPTMEMDE